VTGSESADPGPESDAEPDWKRRRRLAEVFGDALPDTTSDERDPADGAPGRGDTWLREQVPPHHGGQ
jgi:hypothetical protein